MTSNEDLEILKFLHRMGASTDSFTHTGDSLIFMDDDGQMAEMPPLIMDFDKVGIRTMVDESIPRDKYYVIQESRFRLADSPDES